MGGGMVKNRGDNWSNPQKIAFVFATVGPLLKSANRLHTISNDGVMITEIYSFHSMYHVSTS